jgi:hypothetical protein
LVLVIFAGFIKSNGACRPLSEPRLTPKFQIQSLTVTRDSLKIERWFSAQAGD